MNPTDQKSPQNQFNGMPANTIAQPPVVDPVQQEQAQQQTTPQPYTPPQQLATPSQPAATAEPQVQSQPQPTNPIDVSRLFASDSQASQPVATMPVAAVQATDSSTNPDFAQPASKAPSMLLSAIIGFSIALVIVVAVAAYLLI
jgi:hypothetical protein